MNFTEQLYDYADWPSLDEWKGGGVDLWITTGEAFFTRNKILFGVAALCYLPVVFGLQAFMKNRQPFALKKVLAVWNFLMFAFSLVGAYQTVIVSADMGALDAVRPFTIVEKVCRRWCYHFPSITFWIFLFNISKIFEWLDSIFLVLRKRPLPVLHWYHHLVTMLFCWYANQHGHYYHCAGFYFASMNFWVHTVMYGYYFVTCFGYRPKIDFFITSAQIFQMIVGLGVVILTTQCEQVDFFGTVFGLGLYFSFFLLFLDMFVDKYFKGGKGGKKHAE